jgi:hypothetical protein
MKVLFQMFVLFFMLAILSVKAQEVDIVDYLKKIEQGNLDEVKTQLPELKNKHPKSSNVLYLHGLLTENGQDAVVIFQNIVDKYPKSDYADAALYRIYSYYFAIGLYSTADKNLTILKKDYPNSPYLKMVESAVIKPDEIPEEGIPEQHKTANNKDETNYKFTVQAGAFTNPANAAALKKEFEDAGIYSNIKDKNVGGAILKVVYAGRFTDRKEAEDFLQIANLRFNITGRVVEILK